MTNCPLCTSDKQQHLFSKDSRDYLRCTCGFIFSIASPEAAETTADDRYIETYYTPWGINQGVHSPARISKHATFCSWLNKIERYTPTRGAVLDIGCATGFFLDTARERGWNVSGVDVSTYAASEARKRFGDTIRSGTLDAAAFDSGSFDLITAFDVIEHIMDIPAFILEVHRIIKPGGILALTTADSASLSRLALGKKWPQFKPEHCSYFSATTIRRLLDRVNFEIIRIEPARKMLNTAYIDAYFNAYPSVVFGLFFKILSRLLPESIKLKPFTIPTGEMLVIARRTR